jgi:hypothetical protein
MRKLEKNTPHVVATLHTPTPSGVGTVGAALVKAAQKKLCKPLSGW